ncbi:MAG: class I SAM-dependent methyltransferase [Methanobacteriota archaeon]|nr:MAG: class I SAM-dependent methyltransferase [Euryarchaeota archaeon]
MNREQKVCEEEVVPTMNQEEEQEEEQKHGFDIRIVRYEQIHNITDEQFDKLSQIVDVMPGDTILDAGAGYGGVTIALIERNLNKLDNVVFWLSDISSVQMGMAVKEVSEKLKSEGLELKGSELKGWRELEGKGPDSCVKVNFVFDNVIKSKFSDEKFDKVVAKMLIHEIKKECQQKAIDQLYRILKPGGKLIIWDVLLAPENQSIIQSIVREKDKLAGYTDLVKNRYLFTEEEIMEMLRRAGFSNIKKELDIPYTLRTDSRLQCEFKGDKGKLNQWNEFIRNKMQDESLGLHKSLKYRETPDYVTVTFPKGIISCIKPY